MKAARTRAHLVDVAIELFVTQGYDQTTMEQIAETAEVAASTLYRYFPSKDLLILNRLAAFTDLGEALTNRPTKEPVGVSIAVVLRDSLEALVEDPRGPALRKIIDESPVPRARLWDMAAEARASLEEALAGRMKLSSGDLRVTMTARIALQVYEIAAERWWHGDHAESRAAILNEILTSLNEQGVTLPTPID